MSERVYFLNWKYLIFTITTITMLLLALFIWSNAIRSAHTNSSYYVQRVECFGSVQVQPGDSLWSISERYYSSEYKNREHYIKKIMNLNHMTSKNVHAGCYLIIPYYSTASEADRSSSAQMPYTTLHGIVRT